MTNMDNTPVVEMKNISKSFGAVRALIDVNLTLHKNEILGTGGDNSAGKSTLMKVLTGAYNADEGEIHFEGNPVHITIPMNRGNLALKWSIRTLPYVAIWILPPIFTWENGRQKRLAERNGSSM